MSPSSRFAFTAAVLLSLGLGVYWMVSENVSGISAPPPPGDKQRLGQKSFSRPASDISPNASSETAPASPALVAGASSPSANAPASNLPRKTVDVMASWSETPAWPDGPKLYATVETSTTRYVNLRPNEVGRLPVLYVDPAEELKITLTWPEANADEQFFLEIPNGGKFPGESAVGKRLPLNSATEATFEYVADATRGNCTVHIRQRGHTRTLPLWVGAPREHASGE